MIGRRTKLDISSSRKKDVGGFDISMDLALGVKVLKSQEQLSQHDGDMVFTERSGFELAFHVNIVKSLYSWRRHCSIQ